MIASLQTNSSANYSVTSRINIQGTINTLPFMLRIIIAPLKFLIINYLLGIDDSYTVNVADAEMSDSECYSVLRAIGAEMERFENSNICEFFNNEEKTFQKTIWSVSHLKEYMEDIIDFCASAYRAHVDKTALKSTLTSMIKRQVAEEMTTIKKTEIIIIYSENQNQCGVLRLEFDGYQKISTSCCSTGAETKTHVKKSMIMFRDSTDLLHTLKTFIKANQKS
ncbi:unnamed protein product [Adineta steineri]|uniref:Uncharacterized protein n=1 Tax=Adineta steineri TaxID=433720 RepID=A0A819TN44_9BILA|nr:unnamed protein product [Adineta steineri]CAF4082510.1 unnamed protein product [Adineta steineri]